MKIDPNESKELIWLPKSIVEKIKQLENSDNFIQEYLDQSKRDIRANFETFDDEVLGYRASMVKAKSEFQKAADEAIAANYKVWQDFEEKKKSLKAQVEACVSEIKPLTEEMNRLNAEIQKIKHWDIERFLEMIEKLKGHLYGEERNILEFLILNYKKKD
jgi:peptidoglycan hydrolase CwlO-like protein